MSQIHKRMALVENCVFLRRSSNVVVMTIPKHILDRLEWEENDLVIIGMSEDKKTMFVNKGKVVIAD